MIAGEQNAANDLVGDPVELADAIARAVERAVRDYQRAHPCVPVSVIQQAGEVLRERAKACLHESYPLSRCPERLLAVLGLVLACAARCCKCIDDALAWLQGAVKHSRSKAV
jgi:hypothetical protein